MTDEIDTFIAIKYPVDIRFRLEDLDELPEFVIMSWWDKMVNNNVARGKWTSKSNIIEVISNWGHKNDSSNRHIMLNMLREEIIEWVNNEPI